MFPSPSNERLKDVPAIGLRPCPPDVTLKGRIGQDQSDSRHCPHAHHSPRSISTHRAGSPDLLAAIMDVMMRWKSDDVE